MRRGAIRADADELTYPVHIMLRYELEKQIFDGDLAVRDLPEAWRRVRAAARLAPATDTEGCLQDVHWAIGSFGYFPSYALGSFIAAQLYESLRAERPSISTRRLRPGSSADCSSWLRQNVHGAARASARRN